jgi:heme-degrading monooxygenase HmoA
MITEQAVWDIKVGREAEFETTIHSATQLIAQTPGFVSVDVLRCIENPSRFLLLVNWERLEDHTETFRNSPQYLEWRSALDGIYDAVAVQHFESI